MVDLNKDGGAGPVPMARPFDLRTIGRVACALLLVYAGAEVLFALHTIWSLFFFYRFLNDAGFAAEVSGQVLLVDVLAIVVGLLLIATLIAAFIACGIWIVRASMNARAAVGGGERIGPGWALATYAIPIANFWLPFRAQRQTYSAIVHGSNAKAGPVPPYFGWWWAMWLLTGLVSGVASAFTLDLNAPLEDLITGYWLELLAGILSIAAAILFRQVIAEITNADAAAPRPQAA